jgi:hypothetical protein
MSSDLSVLRDSGASGKEAFAAVTASFEELAFDELLFLMMRQFW